MRAGAPPGGDGSRDAPFSSIGEALTRASDGHVIAIASGTYDEVLRVTSSVTLRGACVAETRIVAGTADATQAAIEIAAPAVRIEALTVATSTRGAIAVDGSTGPASLTLHEGVVGGAHPFGVRARGAGAALALERAVVHHVDAEGSGTRPSRSSRARPDGSSTSSCTTTRGSACWSTRAASSRPTISWCGTRPQRQRRTVLDRRSSRRAAHAPRSHACSSSEHGRSAWERRTPMWTSATP
ncbi:MAG: DUF1565 domain-containing protein [Sandaracinaceae bacterium]|nr:DUF1565 domain-containing protein [Sandaracinaceae bacterium]